MLCRRVAHVLPWSSVGGTEQATLRIAQGVESYGFRSTAFCLDEPQAAVRELFAEAGFETASYRGVEPSYRRPKEFLRASFRLAAEFRSRKTDLVHCADLLAAYYAALAGKLARVPVLCHIRCRYEHLSRRDQSFLRMVNRFVFVSNDTWRNFGYRVPAERGAVVYDGIEINGASKDVEARSSVRSEFGIAENEKIVGMVGRIAPAKDYATLIKAARRVVASHPDVRFLIVGDYSGAETYREHYKEVKMMLAANGVTDHFIFTDFRTDVARLLSAIDVFVLSTNTEGMPLVVLEAMSQAKPVVATAVGGIPEIISDGETGLLHRHTDDTQLAAQIISLLQDERVAAHLGERGRRHVETNFSEELFALNMRDVYRQALNLEPEKVTASAASAIAPDGYRSSSKRFEGS